jgi:hypothetical protein
MMNGSETIVCTESAVHVGTGTNVFTRFGVLVEVEIDWTIEVS